jgi:DDE superfamily endonuclease
MLHRIDQAYPNARTIHLVLDNLSTHARSSLVGYFGLLRADELWNRFTIHYTPKQASWLNQAEIEISIFARQCLGFLSVMESCRRLDVPIKKISAHRAAGNEPQENVGRRSTYPRAMEGCSILTWVGRTDTLAQSSDRQPRGCGFGFRTFAGYPPEAGCWAPIRTSRIS